MCAFGVLWLLCEAPAARSGGAAGARTRQPENSKRAHLSVPALQTPPKFHEKTPQRDTERTNFPAGERKKRAKFWAVQGERAVREGVRGRGPKILNTPTTHTQTHTTHTHTPPTGNNQEQQQQPGKTTTTTSNNKQQQPGTNNNKNRKFGQRIETPKLAKCGLAKCGQHFV